LRCAQQDQARTADAPAAPRREARARARRWLTNLGVPMPWPRKLALLARNASLRVLRLQDCCGHPGQPGC
jgi:hypothetical protein